MKKGHFMFGRFSLVGIVFVLLFGVVVAVAGALGPGGTFTDDDGNIHESSIEAIADAGITKGCNPPVNDRYCPGNTVTRGQMAAFLVRALGLVDDGGGNSFIDDDGSVFESDIAKLAAAGITKGCNPPANTKYCPDAAVTRGQMAAFLVRAMGYADSGAGDLFIDDDGSLFENDIDKLGTAGVTKGCNPPVNDRFCPNNPVKRDQMASFLTRALNLTPIVPPPPDTSTTSTTLLPVTQHPQSGDGWEFLACSKTTGTCAYPQATAESQLEIDATLLPPKYCLPNPVGFGCLVEMEQWNFYWYAPSGAQVFPTTVSFVYNGGFLAAVIAKMPIDGAALGVYSGELCRTQFPSSSCVENLLTVYFEVIP